MLWRALFWQQLSQLRNRIIHQIRAILGTWPGLFTLALLLLTLLVTVAYTSRASDEASAQTLSSPIPTQITTRMPTRHATVASTTTQAATATRRLATRTPTPTGTPTWKSTPTWTPFPTATQVAASPLIAETATPSHVVPLPADRTGPQVAPVDVITGSQTISVTLTPTLTASVTASVMLTTPVGGLILLVPTAIPAPTLTITEALELPIGPGGMAGIAAIATAAAPVIEQSATEMPTVTEAEPASEAAPAPVATVMSLPTPDGNVRTAHVPILMYHYLSVPPADADIYRLDLSVTPDLFAQHLDAMQQAGYTTISLYTLIDHLVQGSPLPEKSVVLTFDDGYRDNYTNALPILRDHGMIATFFIVTDFIDDQRPEYLTWDMVREMYAAGMSIEGHGRNHVSLANKDNDYLIWQALGTYEAIEREIGVRPRFICYPAGEYDQATVDIFRSANYWAGFTTKQGATHSSDDLFQMRRVRVRGTTSPDELLGMLALDW